MLVIISYDTPQQPPFLKVEKVDNIVLVINSSFFCCCNSLTVIPFKCIISKFSQNQSNSIGPQYLVRPPFA